jgi:arsenite methyltransferase
MNKNNQKPDYGIDAPGLVKFFVISGFFVVFLNLLAGQFLLSNTGWILLVRLLGALVSIYLLGMGALMIYWSKSAKVTGRESVLNQIQWCGNERVLDVGCGRGLMLIGAAHRLTTGKAIGVDIWQAKDQSSNTPDGGLSNARIEGVLDKVDIQTADMRSLPFQDHSFDVIVSHWVVHNLEAEADRNLSLSEMVRVLQPGGNFILCDIENRDVYIERLKALGLIDCRMMFHPIADLVLGIVSFGSFRPTAIFARKPA